MTDIDNIHFTRKNKNMKELVCPGQIATFVDFQGWKPSFSKQKGPYCMEEKSPYSKAE
jgi:hypothetical protein